MNDWTQDELICAVGTLLLDLRGNWGDQYEDRIEQVIKLSNLITNRDDDVFELLLVCDHQLNDQDEFGRDGRYFRDRPFYGEIPEEGKTNKVKEYLLSYLTYPEYSWVKE